MSEQAPTPHPRRANPVVARIAAVAEAFGPELSARVVFISASLLPLLETEVDVLTSPRPTRDVDAVTATRTYTQKAILDERLRARGLRNEMDATHMYRWRAPDGTLFDLVSCGSHSGGTGSENGLEAELRGATDDVREFVGATFDSMLTPRTIGAIRAHIDDREPLIAGVADTVTC